MDATLASRTPPAGDSAPGHDPGIAHLHCLGSPRLLAFGEWLDLAHRQHTSPIELLLRVAAAGPGGATLDSLEAGLSPNHAPRTRRAHLGHAIHGLASLLGEATSPLHLEGGRAWIDESRLHVDSLTLERALAPLLVPFNEATRDETERARTALARALVRRAVFLPGNEQAWARAARLRIADALARSARHLSCS